jgi:hypothetical protein
MTGSASGLSGLTTAASEGASGASTRRTVTAVAHCGGEAGSSTSSQAEIIILWIARDEFHQDCIRVDLIISAGHVVVSIMFARHAAHSQTDWSGSITPRTTFPHAKTILAKWLTVPFCPATSRWGTICNSRATLSASMDYERRIQPAVPWA